MSEQTAADAGKATVGGMIINGVKISFQPKSQKKLKKRKSKKKRQP